MSHLRKLKFSLAQRFTPKVLPLLKVGHSNTSSTLHLALFQPPSRIITVTKRLREFVIPSVKMTAATNQVCSLCGQQTGQSVAVFVIHKDLVEGQWSGYKSQAQDYDAYLNPEVTEQQDLTLASGHEECPSLPNVKATVSRFASLPVRYQNETGQSISTTLTGFRARVFQHELDHLYGLSLLNFTVSDGELSLIEPRDQSKLLEVLREYKARFRSEVSRARDRYLTDPAFKAKIDAKINGQGIETVEESLEDYAIDSNFESEMTQALENALRDDQIRDLEEMEAGPRQVGKIK